MLTLGLENQPHGALAHFRGKLVRGLAHDAPSYSGVGASGKPSAVQPDTAGAIARNDILRTSKRVGRTIWRRWSGYHRRSRAETKMHCLKLLGQRLSARDFDRQVAEFQVRIAVMNGYTALGTPITEVAG